jgi:very-short-patch-repair endonuclease
VGARETPARRGDARQLRALGFRPKAIEHRIAKGRLHPIWRGVYAVGRGELTQHGWWMAAVLACGEGAVLSHMDAAALWEIRPKRRGDIEVSVPMRACPVRRGIIVHRRTGLTPADVTRRQGIPVTSPICTVIDIAPDLSRDDLEAAINEADKRKLTDPESIRTALEHMPRRPGVGIVRKTLDQRTFTLTRSKLERHFVPLARRAGLTQPLTRQIVNGFEVDFYWPDLGLVVETDGLTYHRTPAQQARDRLRDQEHTARGFTCLRFTRSQVKFDPDHVEAILTAIARRLQAERRHAAAGRLPAKRS